MKILLDVDGVVADFASAYLDLRGYNGPRGPEVLNSWNSILDITQTTSEDIDDAFATCNFALGAIKPYAWADDLVLGIESLGHEVIFCTAVAGVERYKWIARYFPKRRIVQTVHKDLLACDGVVLIDDWDVNIDRFPGLSILFPQPWNRARGGAWEDVIEELAAMSCLSIAAGLVGGNRNADYGHPYHDFKRVVGMMNAAFEHKISVPFEPEDWPMIMQFVKISREIHRPKLDNCVDGGGYWLTRQMCLDKKAELEEVGA